MFYLVCRLVLHIDQYEDSEGTHFDPTTPSSNINTNLYAYSNN